MQSSASIMRSSETAIIFTENDNERKVNTVSPKHCSYPDTKPGLF